MLAIASGRPVATSNLFDFVPSTEPAFQGAAYEAERDESRLTKQIDCIRETALDGEWRTLQKLTGILRKKYPGVGFPENSVQAQLRNLRKLSNGGFIVERRHVANGLFEYRVLAPGTAVTA